MFIKASISCVNGDLLEFAPASNTIYEAVDALFKWIRQNDHEGAYISLEFSGSIDKSEDVYKFLNYPTSH